MNETVILPGMSRALWYDCQVDGKPVLVPDEDVELSIEDLDSDESGRDEGGYMHRQRLREGVRSRSFSYAFLNREDYLYMESLFSGKPEFTFKCLGPDGQTVEYRAYRSKHSITVRNARTGAYKNYKFNVIEC